MGKLGKKARKFAKKNLQSVLRRRRKTKAFFRKKSSSNNKAEIEDEVGTLKHSNEKKIDVKNIEDVSLEAVFAEAHSDEEDPSDSDGYLSEDTSFLDIAEDGRNDIEADAGLSSISMQNRKIQNDLAMQKKKLERLKKKDPRFGEFLEGYNSKELGTFQNDEMSSDEDETSNDGMYEQNGDTKTEEKILVNSVIKSWHQLIKEKNSELAFSSLLNAYRAACHYGTESIGRRFQNSEAFCNTLMLVLTEADSMFRGLLTIPSSSGKRENILELQKTPKWENLKPLIRSYLRSTLFLLNQVSDSDALVFALTRLRVSIPFFVAFPSLIRRLIKATVHLWATGGGALSSASFLIVRDVAAMSGSDFFDSCLCKVFVAYIAQSRVSEIGNVKHMHFMRNSLVELCCVDVPKSSTKALASIHQLAMILQDGLQTKTKEAIKKICSWEYVNCIDVWVMFLSVHNRDYDFQSMFSNTIKIVNGVSYMFPGPRYFPLRLRCIQWLNSLSSSSGIFVPVSSLALDILEYKIVKDGGKSGNAFNFQSVLKLPKHCLKSQAFQAECLSSAIEQLTMHFAQWTFHISFPELATIPLIRLKKFHETTSIESSRWVVKRLIDQMELNVEFVQKKRDEVAFSPKDHQSVESFLQIDKFSLITPFVQYYRSVLEKVALRKSQKTENLSLLERKKS